MTEAEFYEFINSSVSLSTQNLLGFITVLFGYLLCAYLIGRKLTLVQLCSVSVAYTLFSVTNMLSIFLTLTRVGEVASKYPSFYSDPERIDFFRFGVPGLIAFVWLMSILYMVSEYRRSSHEAV